MEGRKDNSFEAGTIRQFLEAEAKALHIYIRRALARSRAAESSWVRSDSPKCLPSRLPNPFTLFEKQLSFQCNVLEEIIRKSLIALKEREL